MLWKGRFTMFNNTQGTVAAQANITGWEADAEALLIDLVGLASPSGNEAAASSALARWMSADGATRAYVDEAGSAIGVFGMGQRQIVLLGHIDTFGGALLVELHGRTLHGRGTVDAKGPLCAFAAGAALAAAQGGIPADACVIVIGAVEEEAPSSKGARFAATQYQPVACLIGEPSAWDRITLGYKGRLIADWSWYGGLGHSAGPIATPGDHAVSFCTRVRTWAEARNAGLERTFARVDTVVQAISSGGDGVHGWSTATIGLRLPPGLSPQTAADELCALAGEGELAFRAHEHAILAERDSAVTRALRGAIRAEGGAPAFVHKTGTSDMNIVAPIWNCPIAAYGPGDSALDHTPDERIDLDEYLKAARVLATALPRL